MANSVKQVRKAVRLKRSPKNAAWILPIMVAFNDKGIVTVNDTITGRRNRPSAERLLSASRFIAEMLEESQIEIEKRGSAT